jgi:hypothetical protein
MTASRSIDLDMLGQDVADETARIMEYQRVTRQSQALRWS